MSSNNTTHGSHTGCRGSTQGMTLWEVILVLVVVALAVAVLFPMFAVARDPCRKTSCVNNMKSLATAMNLYQTDYNGTYPSSYLYNRSKTWNRSDFISFASKRGEIPPPASGGRCGNTLMMLLYDHMKSKDIVWCPSDPDYLNDRPNATISYFFKAANDRAWYAGHKTENDYGYPADQVMFYEKTGWHWGDHGNGFRDDVTLNMAFMDGHIQARRIVDSGGSAVTPAPAAGEPAYYNCVAKTLTPAPNATQKAYFDPRVHCDNLK